MGNKISPGAPEDPGNARPNIPDASKEHNNRGASRYARVLLEHIPGTQNVWWVVPSNRLKQLNAHIYTPHFHMHTISSVLSTIEKGDYSFKIDLQDAYFHVLIHPNSMKYLVHFAFKNKVYQFRVLPFVLNTAAEVFTHLGHRVAAYPHRQGISVIPYFDNLLIPNQDRQALLCHQSWLLHTLDLVGLKLNEAKSELDPVQDIQFLRL